MKQIASIRIVFIIGIFSISHTLLGQLVELNRINFSDSLNAIGADFYRVDENHYLFSGISENWEARIMDCDSNGTINWLYQIAEPSWFTSILPISGGSLSLLERNWNLPNGTLEIHKLNQNGELVDSLILMPGSQGGFGKMILTQDGDIALMAIFGVMSGDSIIPQGYLAKINPNLEIIWSIEDGLDSLIFVSGLTENADGSLAFCALDRIIIISSDGVLLDNLPLPFTEDGITESIISTDDGGYLVGGWELPSDHNSFFLTTKLVKIAASGEVLWTFMIDSTSMPKTTLDQVGDHYLFNSGDMLYSFWNDSVPEWSQTLNFIYSVGHPVGENQYATYGIGFSINPYFFGNQLAIYQLPFETGIAAGDPVVPTGVRLFPAYPNPFNPSTTIRYELPQTESVNVSIYNVQGRLISELTNQVQSAGRYAIQWSGKDNSGRHIPSGIYLCKLATPNYSQTKKLILLK